MYNAKIVKMIGCRHYEIELWLLSRNEYFIRYEYKKTKEVVNSEIIRDFELASHLFSIKEVELSSESMP